MPIRNPFAKRPGLSNGLDPVPDEDPRPTFERVNTTGSKASSALSIRSGKSQDPPEYKMSVVNDSGVYLPPSPPEKRGFWPQLSNVSSVSTSGTSSLNEYEPFSISRESFDSYRRSFDISARSPVLGSDSIGRQSLDSKRLPRLPRSAVAERQFEKQPPTAEEGFEDIGLNDDQKPKKKGFFSKFGDLTETSLAPTTTSSRFSITGRKRGHSGQGAELGTIDRPGTAISAKVEETR